LDVYKENWFQRVKFVKGEYPKWEYPVIEFLAIRNCEKCNRLHYIRNGKKHVYVIDSKKLDDINCSCKEAFAKGELEEYFSMNDFELDEIDAKIRKMNRMNYHEGLGSVMNVRGYLYRKTS